MTQEIVMIEKKRPSVVRWIIVIVSLIVAEIVNRYAVNSIVENIANGEAGRDDFTIFHLLFIVSIIAVFFLTIQFLTLIMKLFDKEKAVPVRKSALENIKARQAVEELKKSGRIINILNGILFSILLSMISFSYIRSGGRESYIIAVVVLIYIFMMNPIKFIASALVKDNNDILIDKCDPVTYFDIIELTALESSNFRKHNNSNLIRIAACYYMGDYDELFKQLDIYERKNLKVNEGINALYYRGAAFIYIGNADSFNVVSAKLNDIETNIKLTVSEMALAKDVRKSWQIMIGAFGDNPASVKGLITEKIKQSNKQLFRIEFTYYLALVQLAEGDEETAILNLKYVAKSGGTTVFCNKAKEILWSKGISLE
ncbi:MAG: hypothetical protein IJ141_03805 [Lachnospiraceae bacterium]|nr:hypothetical protein [Lachnospiraceae bacterium]